jgi:uncharacterized protein
MNKIRVVLDSNVILSAALFKKSAPRQAFDKALAIGQILISTPTLAELEDIFNRPKFDKYISKSARTEFLNDLIQIVENVEIIQSIRACRDRKDDKILELAVNGKAEYIITGDRDLLILNPFQNIAIISIQDFLEAR